MPLKLMYITNDPVAARSAEAAGVDWIFVDLEILGKVERQGHLDTVISRHSLEDVATIRSAINRAKLLVRINPPNDETSKEVDAAVAAGADILMLPYFKTAEDVKQFQACSHGRVQTCLLFETAEAIDNIDHILSLAHIEYAHIGLNDLHLAYGREFMFELLADGTIDRIAEKFIEHDVTFGFGGIARLGEGLLPAENILAEHYRVGSQMAILSRDFQSGCGTKIDLAIEVERIRQVESVLQEATQSHLITNKKFVVERVASIVQNLHLSRLENTCDS